MQITGGALTKLILYKGELDVVLVLQLLQRYRVTHITTHTTLWR